MSPPNRSIAELVRRQSASSQRAEAPATDEDSEYQAFAFGRVGMRPQMTLAVHFADGRLKGFPYAQMLGIETDDEQAGFRVEFPGAIVEIRGRNLKRLLRYVCDHRAAQIDESTPQESLSAAPNGEVVDIIALRRAATRAASPEENDSRDHPQMR